MMKISLLAICVIALLTGVVYAERSEANDHEVLKQMSDNVVVNCNTDTEKVLAILHHIHSRMSPVNVGPVTATSNTSLLDRIIAGSGWCNHQSEACMWFLAKQGIPSRLLFLMNNDNSASHHTIAEAYADGRWIIVDPLFDIEARNAQGGLISRDDVLKNINLLTDLPIMKERLKMEGDRFADWVAMYYRPAYRVYAIDKDGAVTRFDRMEDKKCQ